jgi:RNA polymerase sigma-70 factor (sigma-E family)
MDADAEAEFGRFVAARSAGLFRAAYLLTGDRHEAEDLVQTTLERVAQRWRRIEDAPDAYARRVLYHLQVERWRLRSFRRETPVAHVPEVERRDHSAGADLRVSLVAALGRLTRRQRAVLVLRYFEDLSEAETARLLDISVGTVRSTASRTLARLRVLHPELLHEEAPR